MKLKPVLYYCVPGFLSLSRPLEVQFLLIILFSAKYGHAVKIECGEARVAGSEDERLSMGHGVPTALSRREAEEVPPGLETKQSLDCDEGGGMTAIPVLAVSLPPSLWSVSGPRCE